MQLLTCTICNFSVINERQTQTINFEYQTRKEKERERESSIAPSNKIFFPNASPL